MVESDTNAGNGFLALIQYDRVDLGGNEDGSINKLDGIWELLYLWNDFDGNGICEVDEMTQLDDTTITDLNPLPIEKLIFDPFNNLLRFFSEYHYRDHKGNPATHQLIDVYFKKVFGNN